MEAEGVVDADSGGAGDGGGGGRRHNGGGGMDSARGGRMGMYMAGAREAWWCGLAGGHGRAVSLGG